MHYFHLSDPDKAVHSSEASKPLACHTEETNSYKTVPLTGKQRDVREQKCLESVRRVQWSGSREMCTAYWVHLNEEAG